MFFFTNFETKQKFILFLIIFLLFLLFKKSKTFFYLLFFLFFYYFKPLHLSYCCTFLKCLYVFFVVVFIFHIKKCCLRSNKKCKKTTTLKSVKYFIQNYENLKPIARLLYF